MAAVSLERVSCAFRARRQTVWAVQDLSLDVADGEYVVLVGPSGCGKTTTLRLIAGLESPAGGSIHIGPRRVNDVAPKDRDVAMVFQNYALYPHMTVFKNLAFGLKMRRTPKAEIRRRVDTVAERLQITGLLDRRPAALSGGEKQRVALGRAIVREPQVFLFDEPLSNLDVSLRLRTRADLKTLHRDLGTTIVHVTHDQEEAMTLGDRIAVLRDGRLQQFAAPLEVYRRPTNRFVAGFVGSPPMNLVPGRLDHADGAIAFVGSFGSLPLPASLAETLLPHVPYPVVLGLRPQHLALGDGRPQTIGGPAVLHNCKVRLIEPLGDSVNVQVESVDGTVWVAKGPASLSPQTQRVDLFLDLANAHFFAADDEGRRLN